MLNQNVNKRDLGMGRPQMKRKNMNHQFDELTKSLAQSVTRRAALKKFGLVLMMSCGVSAVGQAQVNPPETLPANAAALRANAGVTFVLAPTPDPSAFKIVADGVVQ